MNKVRNSNLELLRILSMYMIVFIHANMYLGRFCSGVVYLFFNGLVNGICNIGVTCFILISGYYGMQFKMKKLVKMECMMITYSLLETAILYLVYPEQMTGAVLLEAVIKSLFPVITRKYWFYSCYVCLYLLSGFIHRFVEGLSKKEFKKLLLLLLVLFSVFPTVFYFEIMPDNGKGLVSMIMIYLIGRYIRRYRDIALPVGKAMAVFVCLWLINGISHEIPIHFGGIYHHFCKDNSITNIIMAIILFLLFKELKLKNKLVNKVASCLFAVFALNSTLVTVFMELFDRYGLFTVTGILGFISLAGIVLGILLLCIALGSIREALLKKADNKLGEYIERKYSDICKKDILNIEVRG